MHIFVPVWNTPETVPPADEGDTISLQVGATLEAAFIADGDAIIVDPEDGARMTRVTVNGVEEDFTHTNGIIVIDTNINVDDLVRMYIDDFLTFDLHIDDVPPGITLSTTGLLQGTIGEIAAPGAIHYDFLVRGYYEDKVIGDHRFQWDVTPEPIDITWGMVLPPLINVIGVGDVYDLGVVKRGSSFIYQLALTNPNSLPATIEFSSVTGIVTDVDTFNGVLPPDVLFSQASIEGTVTLTANLGEYFFELSVDSEQGPAPLNFKLTVADSTLGEVSPTNTIVWVTESDLGTITEGQPVSKTVTAIDLIGGTVTYMVSPGQSMPAGLAVTSAGLITGQIDYTSSVEISFWIRAISGLMYSDRQFTMTVNKVFADDNYSTALLAMSRADALALKTKMLAVSGDILFRAADPNYQPDGYALLLKGFNDDGERLLDLHFRDNDLDLICGELEVARAVIDGAHMYDVVFRRLYDPLEKAGGFDFDGSVFNYAPKEHPQVEVTLKPASIKNMRADLVDTYGLNTVNPLLDNVLGLDGGESLPVWMTCEQADGSRLGYIAAIVEGYAVPGLGEDMIEAAGFDAVLHTGQVLKFDRILKKDVAFTRIKDTL